MRKVLVVDDQQPILELLSLYLSEEGYHVDSAHNGAGALAKFGQGHWDLVITDRMMPGISGDELAAAIRQLDPKIGIVLVSGFTEVHPATGAFQFNAVLSKPFTKEALLDVVRATLGA